MTKFFYVKMYIVTLIYKIYRFLLRSSKEFYDFVHGGHRVQGGLGALADKAGVVHHVELVEEGVVEAI